MSQKPKTIQDLINEAMGNKVPSDFAREYASRTTGTGDFTDPFSGLEEKPLKGKKIKSRRMIKLMFNKCPICYEKISDKVDSGPIDPKIKIFRMVQFSSNPDDTGYESYWCGFCKKFFMMMINNTPIAVIPQFKMA